MKQISAGNFEKIVEKRNNAWVIGHFIEPDHPFCINDFEVKWGNHQKGESKSAVASSAKSKSLCILISGKISLSFPDHNESVILQHRGDYVFWDKGVSHRWSVLENSLVLTIRWPSIPSD